MNCPPKRQGDAPKASGTARMRGGDRDGRSVTFAKTAVATRAEGATDDSDDDHYRASVVLRVGGAPSRRVGSGGYYAALASAESDADADDRAAASADTPAPVSRAVSGGATAVATAASMVASASDAASDASSSVGRVASATSRTARRSLSVALATDAWGVDTMASTHISGNMAQFVAKSMRTTTPVQVQMADSGVVTASQRGSVLVRVATPDGRTVAIRVDDVYYHPSFSTNLLS